MNEEQAAAENESWYKAGWSRSDCWKQKRFGQPEELEAKTNNWKLVWQKASQLKKLSLNVGDKVGENILAINIKALSREIAGNIKNFQGKTIRSYDEAMDFCQ